MLEEWKDIIGYEGLYQVSNLGNVKALSKSHYNQFGAKITFKEKILKPLLDRYGYLIISLSKNSKARRCSVARLVGLHFLPPPENNKMVVAHIDSSDKTNNNVSNLTWNIINKCRAKKTNKIKEFIKKDDFINIDVHKVSGIYKITNIVNNKIYIGSAINILNRLIRHFWDLRLNTSTCTKLQRAFNKYGEGNFKIDLIETCEIIDLEEREQYYIDTLKPEYNIKTTVTRNKKTK